MQFSGKIPSSGVQVLIHHNRIREANSTTQLGGYAHHSEHIDRTHRFSDLQLVTTLRKWLYIAS